MILLDSAIRKEKNNNGTILDNLKAEKQVAEKTIVLLKNEHQLLPLSKQTKTIALIGPFIKVSEG